ncbi:CHC2 zinc finger domain-containing protein [Comamonas sp. 4034]|uniref:CHC2 zinc finger domain-containing protein n=1 Tax=Comamonas sp. 4034 TaxID=3156455 RepID=UPI003D22DD34
MKLGKGKKWVTTACAFHGGSDSMRINLHSGAFVCMAGCGARGGDVLAYHMAAYGLGFIDAAKVLGCWIEDGSLAPAKPTPFTARQALEVLAVESNLIAIAAANIASGVVLSQDDRQRVRLAANRIHQIGEVFA